MDDIKRKDSVTRARSGDTPSHRVAAVINFAEERKRSVTAARSLIGDVSPARPRRPVVQQPQMAPTSQAAVQQRQQKPVVSKASSTHQRQSIQRLIKRPEHLSESGKVTALMRALDAARKQAAKEQRKKLFFKRAALMLSAVVILLSTGYVGIDTWITNARLKAGAVAPAEQPVASTDQDGEAVDSVRFADDVSKEAQPANILDSYKVAADQPRALYIKKIGTAARIIPVGEKDGAVDAPKTVYDSGWYTKSALPGTSGASLIDGHSPESGLNYGIFARLDRLVNGDEITVEMGDGTRHAYVVAAMEVVPYDAVDMRKALAPYGGSSQGLNIITCHGSWLDEQKTLDHRLIVYAVPA